MDDKLVTLEKYEMLYEAEFTKDILEENGIKAMIVGETLRGDLYRFANTAFIELKIFATDVDKAKQIIISQQDAENGQG